MQKKWGILLSVLWTACLLTITTVSIVIWAVVQKRIKEISGNGSVTITVKDGNNGGTVSGAAIAGTICGGIQLNDGSAVEIDGVIYKNSAEIITPQDLANVGNFNIGDINLTADTNGSAHIYIWFTVYNADTAGMTASINLWSGTAAAKQTGENFLNGADSYNMTTVIYDANFVAEEFESAAEIISYMENYRAADTPFAPDSGITTHTQNYNADIGIDIGTTKNIIIYYAVSNITANAPEFNIGIDLEFSIV
jgi:hypothetical protein